MKRLIILVGIVLPLLVDAQITIDKNDMPVPGDTFRISTAVAYAGDPAPTGANYIWDFSALEASVQRIDTFIDPVDAPGLYGLIFGSPVNPNRATVAVPTVDTIEFIPNMQVADPMDFLKANNSFYGRVGIGITISGIPLAIQYTSPEEFYRFPLDYFDTFTDEASYEIVLPTVGYFGEELYRETEVDGFGTLKLPMGDFEVIRVKSTITRSDSVYVESTGIGLALPPVTTTEYHWLGKEKGVPLLQINTALMANATVNYLDNPIDSILFAVDETLNSEISANVFPNPSLGTINFDYSLEGSSRVVVDLVDANGKLIAHLENSHKPKGKHSLQFNTDDYQLSNGLYYLKLSVGGQSKAHRFVLIK